MRNRMRFWNPCERMACPASMRESMLAGEEVWSFAMMKDLWCVVVSVEG